MQSQTPSQTPRTSPGTGLPHHSHSTRWGLPPSSHTARLEPKFNGAAPVRLTGTYPGTETFNSIDQLPSPDSSPNLRSSFSHSHHHPSSSYPPPPIGTSPHDSSPFNFAVWGPPVIPPHSQINQYAYAGFDHNTNSFTLPPSATTYSPSPYSSTSSYEHHLQPNPLHTPPDYSTPISIAHISTPPPSSTPPLSPAALRERERATLLLADLEPWMDEAYASQLCGIMQWEGVDVTVPPLNILPDPTATQADSGAAGRSVTGSLQPNNPGYCFLTFPSPPHAARVLSEVEAANKYSFNKQTPSILLPNSNHPLNLSWALPGSLSTASAASSALSPSSSTTNATGYTNHGPHSRSPEFSIFVGDLAPETTNQDLVSVFRDPTLGLRPDREPRAIRPFLSCKGAKIMTDPVTGLSKGYGFVRFTDEADMQRALIEMQGLYCMSRPMRISHATAKSKPATNAPPQSAPHPPQFPSTISTPAPLASSVTDPVANVTPSSSLSSVRANTSHGLLSPVSTTNSPASGANPIGYNSDLTKRATRSVSSPIANGSSNDQAAAAITKPAEALQHVLSELSPDILTQIAQIAVSASASITASAGTEGGPGVDTVQALASLKQLEESIRDIQRNGGRGGPLALAQVQQLQQQQGQARALIANYLVGPNGGVLNSTDPYNTTVFIGGLSGLISEETLKTFFAPFGEIHYVKIPPGKGCGFVQFVKKADAERAIDRMQGFPIGGGRIRLSWGRSQSDKAAQAAAQAAHLGLNLGAIGSLNGLNLEQAIQMFSNANMIPPPGPDYTPSSPPNTNANSSASDPPPYPRAIGDAAPEEEPFGNASESAVNGANVGRSISYPTSFSPWSPVPSNDSPSNYGSAVISNKSAPGAIPTGPSATEQPPESGRNGFAVVGNGVPRDPYSSHYERGSASSASRSAFQASDILRQDQGYPQQSHYPEVQQQSQRVDGTNPFRRTTPTPKMEDLTHRLAGLHTNYPRPPPRSITPGSIIRQSQSHAQFSNEYNHGYSEGSAENQMGYPLRVSNSDASVMRS